ncbi:uncharacterized protein [Aristolochia californica]|uniref:uncharacterized protein n=1 Tax=Aristolochia californica TaxID=171875 RepID=UPI0035DB308F
MAAVVGLSTSRYVWVALENTFSHHSKARELRLKDDLQLMKRGTKPVVEYARTFKALCDQLHAIGRPVEDIDKVHWFLRGPDAVFSSFFTAQMALTTLPYFADLVSKAETFELFQRSLELSTTTAAFTATNRSRTNAHGTSTASRGNHRGRTHSHGRNSSNQGRTHFGQGRRPPRYKICPMEGHYADRCNQRYVQTDSSAHLSEAFNTSCSLSRSEATEWFLDTGAFAHMTTDPTTLDQSKNYTGKDFVIVGNGASLPITHTSTFSPVPNIHLLDVLGVPHLTKNLLSISKLTSDFPLSVTFNNASFTIQNRQTGRVVATGKRDGGLYVLERGNSAFLSVDNSLAGASLPSSVSSPPSIETAAHPPSPLGSMITRAKVGIFKPRHPTHLGVLGSSGLLPALLTSTEPKGFKSAAKNPAWLAAMDEEVQALQQNDTWILVPHPLNTNIVGSKWVFRTKYLPDGSVERLKARLVAKGYTQVPGLDYTDTFSPVVKAITVRVVLSLVVTNKWPLQQVDVNNAFLNGNLTEHVYMHQPPGYIDPRFSTHVCLLKKAFYGLKQAPHAWFQCFSSFLLTLGFSCSRADTSLFVFHQHSSLIYLLLYVDDIIVTGNNPSLLDNFTHKLHSEFATKDLGSLSYFLGLEASPTSDGLFIS